MVSRLIGAGVVVGTFALSGCSLILDFSETSDAGPSDAAVADAADMDAGDPCTLFEPNNDISSPTILIPGAYGPAGICPGNDRDYYRFVLAGNEDVTIDILFDNMSGQGDLELRLYDGVGAQVDQSQTFDDNEQIRRTLLLGNQLPADSYTFEVYGVLPSTQNNYTIQLAITPAAPPSDAGVADAI